MRLKKHSTKRNHQPKQHDDDRRHCFEFSRHCTEEGRSKEALECTERLGIIHLHGRRDRCCSPTITWAISSEEKTKQRHWSLAGREYSFSNDSAELIPAQIVLARALIDLGESDRARSRSSSTRGLTLVMMQYCMPEQELYWKQVIKTETQTSLCTTIQMHIHNGRSRDPLALVKYQFC